MCLLWKYRLTGIVGHGSYILPADGAGKSEILWGSLGINRVMTHKQADGERKAREKRVALALASRGTFSERFLKANILPLRLQL